MDYETPVYAAFIALLSAFDRLRLAYLADESPAPTLFPLEQPFAPPLFENPKEQLLFALENIYYLQEQPPKEIYLLPGLAPVNASTYAALEALNAAKHAFKAAVLDLKNQKLSLKQLSQPAWNATIDTKRNSSVAWALQRKGLSALHLKQAYRLPILCEHTPQSVRWTWAHTRGIQRISLEEAEARLISKNSERPGIQIQLNKLKALSPGTTLAVVQNLAPHIRSNLVFSIAGQTVRKMSKGGLPIFYRYQPTDEAPLVTPIREKTLASSRSPRSDQKIDNRPFLESIHAHLYL